MSEIVNLRQVRKRADRAKREDTAAINRARFGQGKAERAVTKAEADKRRAVLDGAKKDGAK